MIRRTNLRFPTYRDREVAVGGHGTVCKDCRSQSIRREVSDDRTTDDAAAAAHDRRHGAAQHVAIDSASLRAGGQELRPLLSTFARQAQLRGRSNLPATS